MVHSTPTQRWNWIIRQSAGISGEGHRKLRRGKTEISRQNPRKIDTSHAEKLRFCCGDSEAVSELQFLPQNNKDVADHKISVEILMRARTLYMGIGEVLAFPFRSSCKDSDTRIFFVIICSRSVDGKTHLLCRNSGTS